MPQKGVKLTDEQKEARRAKAIANRESRMAARPPDDEFFSGGAGYEEPQIVTGTIEPDDEEAAHPAPGRPADAAFQLFYLSLDLETRELLDEGELRRIYAEQLAKAEVERRAARKREATELAFASARRAMGLVPKDVIADLELARFNAEPMMIKIRLPPADENGNVADIGLRIDQRILLDGVTYQVTRAQFDSYRDHLYHATQHELEFLGLSKRRRAFYMNERMGHDPRWHISLDGDA